MRFAFLLMLLHSVLLAKAGDNPQITPEPKGPYHVEGTRIVNAQGTAFLLRGAEMPTVTLQDKDFRGDNKEFGPFSPTSLITIRQRLNMNAVRLPVKAQFYVESAAYRARVEQIVQTANRFQLLVILALDDDANSRFWIQCATDFRSNPNLFFAPAGRNVQALAGSIRSSGAEQPLVLTGPVRERNVIFQVSPRHSALGTDADRWREAGSLAERGPVLVNDLDPRLDEDSAECAAFPGEPAAATRLLEHELNYFDTHGISWTLSPFRPGRMLSEYRFYNWSRLDDGWKCGESPSRGGIGMILMSHLWDETPLGLFAVDPRLAVSESHEAHSQRYMDRFWPNGRCWLLNGRCLSNWGT